MRKVALVVLAALAAACSSGGSDDPPPPPPPPPPPSTGDFRLVNSATVPIHQVYITESTNPSWGGQRNTGTVYSGNSFTLMGLAPDYWDMKAVSVGAVSRYNTYASDQWVTAGSTTQVTAANSGFTGSIEVFNGDYTYYYSIVDVFISLSSSSSWGADQLGTSSIATGVTWDFYNLPSYTYYDVWCQYSDGFDEYAYDVYVGPLSYTNVTCNGI